MQRSVEKGEWDTAVNYTSQILEKCAASEKHCIQKLQFLLKGSKLKEAVDYSRQVSLEPVFANSSMIKGARGRLLVYDGKEAEGKQVL